MLPDLPPPGPDGRYSAEQMVEFSLWVAAHAVTLCAEVGRDAAAADVARACACLIQRRMCTDKEKAKALARLREYRHARNTA